LADLLEFYHSIPDPELKNQLAWNFSWEARESMTLEEVVEDVTKEGKTPEEARREAIGNRLHQALGEGANLLELFGEGNLTRAELLDELRLQIPGSEAYPEALEQAVWRRAAWAADPQEIADWAQELSRRGDMDELMIQAFATGNLSGDPRIPLRLARYRTITKGMPDE